MEAEVVKTGNRLGGLHSSNLGMAVLSGSIDSLSVEDVLNGTSLNFSAFPPSSYSVGL